MWRQTWLILNTKRNLNICIQNAPLDLILDDLKKRSRSLRSKKAIHLQKLLISVAINKQGLSSLVKKFLKSLYILYTHYNVIKTMCLLVFFILPFDSVQTMTVVNCNRTYFSKVGQSTVTIN